MDVIVFQVLSIIVLAVFSLTDFKRWREILFILILGLFVLASPYMSFFYKILITLVALITGITFYILKKTFPFLSLKKKRLDTSRLNLLVFVLVVFIMALLNIFQFSQGLVLDIGPIETGQVFRTLKTEEILRYITVSLVVVTVGIAKMEFIDDGN